MPEPLFLAKVFWHRLRSHLLLISVLLALMPQIALAHTGEPITPDQLWWAWNWDWLLLLSLALTIWMYQRGVRVLWARAGVGRGIRVWQVVAFGLSMLALFVALISPIDALGHTLFSAHMVQHLLLILVAAPLLVLSAPHMGCQWALPLEGRREIGQWWRRKQQLHTIWNWLVHPLVAWVLLSFALWIWHAPGLYEAALASTFVHAVEHACFFVTALFFWWAVIYPSRRHSFSYGIGLFAVFTMMMQSGVVGALITFAPTPWYPAHAVGAAAWGLTALEDQQLAGLIMWVPASVIYLLAALLLFAAWLRVAETRAAHNERQWMTQLDRREV